jgi:uncharacterized membrane protein YuzA (DUF378 family)
MSRKRIVFLMSILVIVVTLTVGIVGVLNFNKCKESGGTWSYEKKICEHSLKKP